MKKLSDFSKHMMEYYDKKLAWYQGKLLEFKSEPAIEMINKGMEDCKKQVDYWKKQYKMDKQNEWRKGK